MLGQSPDPSPDLTPGSNPDSAGEVGPDASPPGAFQATQRLTWTDEAGQAIASEEDVAAALAAALRHGGDAGRNVDVIAVGAATLARMHGQFLGDPSETDVITFDLRDRDAEEAAPDGGASVDGEIYISADRAREVGTLRSHGPRREFILYVVHGALHLCGFDDHEPGDRAAMRDAERTVMAELGYPPDPSPHDL